MVLRLVFFPFFASRACTLASTWCALWVLMRCRMRQLPRRVSETRRVKLLALGLPFEERSDSEPPVSEEERCARS